MDQVPDIAQTALLLEESIPGLQVIGLDYDQALDALEAQLRLMSHPRVVQDAKGASLRSKKNINFFLIFRQCARRRR